MLRKPVVQGQFYPETLAEVHIWLKTLQLTQNNQLAAKGLILPHAGYIYSGKVAAVTLSKIQPKKRIIMLGPNHNGFGYALALSGATSWQAGEKTFTLDQALTESILSQSGPIKKDDSAHNAEHSLEVMLPLLDFYCPNFTFTAISCMPNQFDIYCQAAKQISQAIKDFSKDILIIASSDFTHYETDQSVRKKDRLALGRITDLDSLGLIKVIEKEKISLCGIAPIAILLEIMKIHRATKVQVANYDTSASINNDFNSAVGYAGIIIN